VDDMIRFGSVCSGIEAASVAWHPLGWRAAWLSEIEPFPSAVLAHHYPDVPNLGDMTALPDLIELGLVEAPDVFCGGTPCQAFSVAGLRKSLDDARGNLSLTFCEIANAIDNKRNTTGLAPAIIFWENVPGVLSTKDNAFGCFLAGIAGEDQPLEPPGGKWANAGYVLGPKRAVAWRVLDAQYFGVAQRRRRVFVVASARDDFDPAEILFEFDGVRRDTAPSREARQGVAGGIEIGPGGGRFTDLNPTLDTRAKDGPVRNQLAGAVMQPYTVANCLTARMHKGMNSDCNEGQTPVVSYAIQGSMIGRNDNAGPQGDGINEEVCFTQNCVDKHGVAYGIRTANTSSNGWGIQEEVTHTLDCANGVAVAVSLRGRDGGATAELGDEVQNCLRASQGGGDKPHVLAPVAQPMPINTMIALRHEALGEGTGFGIGEAGDPAYTLTKGHSHAVAQPIGLDEEQNAMINAFGTLKARMAGGGFEGSVMQTNMAVRRLTPVECERLQGFPDGYTNIPWRNKPESPDGPRYKALGNSWAVPVVRWIGKRINEAVKC
jgi:DNA (cytosine-5)-methyltransferase 1